MKLIEVKARDFDLSLTLDSGQVFHWEKLGAGHVGLIGARAVYLQQRGARLRAPPAGAAEVRLFFPPHTPLL